jgi:hypothetical protein
MLVGKINGEIREINGVSVVDLTAKLLFLVGGGLALEGIAKPNKSVKGTHRPLAVSKLCFLPKFDGFVHAQ